MSRALAKQSEAQLPAPIVADSDKLMTMIEKIMLTPDLPAERVQQAIDFYRQVDSIAAKKAFDAAMAEAKPKFAPIIKTHLADRGGAGTYKFEDLFDLNAAVDPALAECGLNTRYRSTSKPGEPITVTCIVTHTQGYSDETTLSAGADSSGGKNSIQAIGSTVKYLMRYTKELALGIAASREDDGKAASGKPAAEQISVQQAEDLGALIQRTKEPSKVAQIYLQHCKVKSFDQLSIEQFDKIKAHLKEKHKVE